MGGGGGQQAPQYDAAGAARAQQQANTETGIANAWLGNTNQNTPQGNLTYQQTGTQKVGQWDVPTFTATTTLAPQQQQIYDTQTGLQQKALDTAGSVVGQVQNSIGTPLNYSGLPQVPTDQTQARNDAYNALTARSNQDLGRTEDQLKTQLANQGIAAGTDAYNNAMLPLERARVDASNQATINAGNLAGQNIQQAQTLRNQGIQERTSLRNQPLQDYATLLGFGGSVQSPNWAPTNQSQIANTDTISPSIAAYQGQVNAYNQQLQSQNAMMGGLFGLGGSALGALGTIGGAAFL